MPILSFDYTKQGAKEPKPKVIFAIYEPSDKYFGVDISELDIEDQGNISAKLEEAGDAYRARIEKLMEEYDIKHSYRYFFPEKMENLVEE